LHFRIVQLGGRPRSRDAGINGRRMRVLHSKKSFIARRGRRLQFSRSTSENRPGYRATWLFSAGPFWAGPFSADPYRLFHSYASAQRAMVEQSAVSGGRLQPESSVCACFGRLPYPAGSLRTLPFRIAGGHVSSLYEPGMRTCVRAWPLASLLSSAYALFAAHLSRAVPAAGPRQPAVGHGR